MQPGEAGLELIEIGKFVDLSHLFAHLQQCSICDLSVLRLQARQSNTAL